MIHQEAVKEYFAAWNAHDASKLAPLFAKDGTDEDPMSRMAIHSWDLSSVLWSIETVLPDFTFEISSIACAEERATVEWTLRGTNSKPLKPGIDPTGKVTTLRVELFEGADGFKRVQR